MFKKIIFLILLLILFTACTNVQKQEDTFDKIMRTNVLKACYMPWPDSIIKDPNTNELSGFLIDIVMEIASEAKLTLVFTQSTWGGFPNDLQSGKCDVVIGGVYPLISRSRGASFTRPIYYVGNSGLVQKNDNRFNRINDLNNENITISVVQGNYDYVYAKRFLHKANLLVLDKTSAEHLPLVSVSSGRADIALSATDTVVKYAREHPETKAIFVNPPYSTKPASWAVRSEDQKLLNFLNNAITYLEATGYLEKILKKYDSVGWYFAEVEYK
jgi:ABC-type amino acid transport substrate-binding protein